MFHSWISQQGTTAVMALSPEDVRYLRHWQVSIQCLPRDPDLDFIRCLRTISERIVPQLVPAINLEEHRRQTKFSACDEFASEIWAGYLEGMIKRNDKELADIFKRVSEEVPQHYETGTLGAPVQADRERVPRSGDKRHGTKLPEEVRLHQ